MVYDQEDQLCDYGDFLAKLDTNMRNVAGKLTLESSAQYDMPIIVKDPFKLNTLANSFVNFKANNYGYTTALNNALKLPNSWPLLIPNTRSKSRTSPLPAANVRSI